MSKRCARIYSGVLQGDFKLERTKQERRWTEDTIETEFIDLTKSIWRFSTASAKRIGHPTVSRRIAEALLEFYTFKGEVVLDPFMGSGSTRLAAKHTGEVHRL